MLLGGQVILMLRRAALLGWSLCCGFIILVGCQIFIGSALAQVNMGFETPTLAEGGYEYAPTGGSWTFSAAGIQRNGSAWGASAAPQGVQTAFLQSASGLISQTFYLVAGTYTVSFYAARRTGQIQPIQVLLDDIAVGPPITPASDAFALYTTSSFIAQYDGWYTLQFAGTNPTGDNSSFIDDVSVNPTDQAPSLTLTSPANNARFVAPGMVSLSASVADDSTISKVQFSRDGDVIAIVTTPTSGTTSAGIYTYTDSNVPAGNYTYTAKVYDNADQWRSASARKVSVSPIGEGSVNVAAQANGGVATASSFLNPNYPPSGANDGDRKGLNWGAGGGWNDGTPHEDDWLQINFNGTYTIGQIDVFTVQDNYASPAEPTASMTFTQWGILNFDVAYWDGSAWQAPWEAYAVENEFVWRRFAFSPVTTNAIRVRVTSTPDGTARITEVEAWTATAPTNSPPTVTLTSPANNAMFTAPASVPLSATAIDSDGTISKVEFYRGATLIATITAAPYNATDSNVPAGNYSYTAKVYDNNNAVTTSAATTVVVNAAPAVSLTSPPLSDVVAAPANIALAATATDSDGGTITKVEFYRGATLINTDTTAPYSYTDPNVAAGTYSYTAKAYDNNGGITTSAASVVTVVNNVAPAVSITAPATNTVLPAPGTVNLVAIATDSNDSISKVEFYRGTTFLMVVLPDFGPPPPTWEWGDQNVPAGTYTYTAKAYDTFGASTTSAVVTVIVNSAPSVAITAPANNATFAAPATVNISATASDSDGSISKVEFYRGATLINTDTVAPYSYSDVNVAAGTYSYTAKAYDNNNAVTTSAAVNVTVTAGNAAPTVSITAPANNTVITAPATVSLSATAADADGTISKVEFYRGATLIATITTAPYNATDSNVPAGSYSYTARAYDNSNAVTTSAAVNVTVTAGNAAPTVSITAPENNTVITAPATVSLSATAADADGSISKVEFYRGATLIATITTAPYNATDSNVPVGSYSYTAKAYDNNNAVTTSAVVNVTVATAASIFNSGFETPQLAAGTYDYAPTGNSWTFSSAGIQSNGSAWGASPAPQGVQTAFLQGGSSRISQSVTLAAGSYTVSFYAARRNTQIQPIQVLIDGKMIGTLITPTSDAFALYTTSAFTVAEGLHTLQFSGTNPTGDNSSFIDAVTIASANQPPSITLTAPTNNSTFAAPATINLAASAGDTDGTLTKVEFYRGATLIETVTAAPYSVTDPNLPDGSYGYTAKAYDNTGNITTSATVNVTVGTGAAMGNGGFESPVLAAAEYENAPSGARWSFAGSAGIQRNGSVWQATIAPEGQQTAYMQLSSSRIAQTFNLAAGTYTVSFYAARRTGQIQPIEVSIDGVAVGGLITPASDAFALYTTSPFTVEAGPHTLQLSGTNPTGDNSSFIDAASVTSTNQAPTVTLTLPANNAIFVAPATVNLSASAADTDGTISKVEFYRGATLIATVTAAPYTANDANLAAGSYSYTAKAYDNTNAVTTSAVVTVTVTAANAVPSVSITAPANNTVTTAPATVNLSASAADADGTISKVEFYRGATLIATVTAPPYNATDANLLAGTYSYTAKAYDNLNAVTTSAVVSVVVNAAPTVSITAPANNATFTAPAGMLLSATAADSDGTISKVEFYRGATLIATVMAAPYTASDANLAAGNYSYTAKAYDNNNAVTTSAVVNVTVTAGNAAPTVSITAPANNASFTAPATVNLSASAADTDGTISKVEFHRGATLIATVTATPYTATDANLAAGSYSYTARAYDNAGGITTSAAVTVISNTLPTVSITTPANNTVITPPATVNLTATAADSDGTLSKVEFYRGATLIGTVIAAPYNAVDSNVAAGAYSYTAKAYDNNGGITTSAAVAVIVNALPTVAITAPANAAVYQLGQVVAITATPTDPDSPIRKVEFYRGTTLMATVTALPYTAVASGLAAGSYQFTAKAYDDQNALGISAPVNVIVNAAPTVSITAPASNTVLAAPANLTLTTSPADSDGTISKVEFYNGATLVGTANAAPFNLSLANLGAGPYSFTAKAFDNNGGITTSAAVNVTVSGSTAATAVIYQYDELGRLIGVQH